MRHHREVFKEFEAVNLLHEDDKGIHMYIAETLSRNVIKLELHEKKNSKIECMYTSVTDLCVKK